MFRSFIRNSRSSRVRFFFFIVLFFYSRPSPPLSSSYVFSKDEGRRVVERSSHSIPCILIHTRAVYFFPCLLCLCKSRPAYVSCCFCSPYAPLFLFFLSRFLLLFSIILSVATPLNVDNWNDPASRACVFSLLGAMNTHERLNGVKKKIEGRGGRPTKKK